MTTKQAWKKFLSSNGEECNIVIHCDTKEKAKKLLKYLHKKGFTWYGGTSLTKKTNWLEYKNETCYTSEVMFDNKENFLKDNFDILSFDDIEKYIDKKKKVDIEKYFRLKKEVTCICEIYCANCPLSSQNNNLNMGCSELEELKPYMAYKLLKKAKKEKEEKENEN